MSNSRENLPYYDSATLQVKQWGALRWIPTAWKEPWGNWKAVEIYAHTDSYGPRRLMLNNTNDAHWDRLKAKSVDTPFSHDMMTGINCSPLRRKV